MPFLLANWKVIAIGMAIVITFGSGWHAHTIYDGYKTDKEKTKTIEKLGEGLTNITNFNQDFDKEKVNAKDDKCVDARIPAGLLKLQQQ